MMGLMDSPDRDYLDFILRTGREHEDVFDVPAEYYDVVRSGDEYEALTACLGWRRLLDDMEARANRALARLRACASSNAELIRALRDRWREAEESMEFVQRLAGDAIQARAAVYEDVGARFSNGTGLDVNDLDDIRKIREFMSRAPGPESNDGAGGETDNYNNQYGDEAI